MSASLTALEEKVVYLERHVVEQDRAMLALSDQLERLKNELRGLRERVASSDAGEGAMPAPADERPPHY